MLLTEIKLEDTDSQQIEVVTKDSQPAALQNDL
jgi:hypothetical protein